MTHSVHKLITLVVVLALIISCPLASKSQETQQQTDALARAAALYRAQRYAEALKIYQKVASSSGDSGDAELMTGYCLYQLRRYKEALAAYRTASKRGVPISVSSKAQKCARSLDLSMRGICPGNCLKPSTPGWRKMHVDGKPDYLVWMVFPYLDPAGAGGSEYWSNDHMGEVIEYVNGRPIDKGKCPICGGTGQVTLP